MSRGERKQELPPELSVRQRDTCYFETKGRRGRNGEDSISHVASAGLGLKGTVLVPWQVKLRSWGWEGWATPKGQGEDIKVRSGRDRQTARAHVLRVHAWIW